MNEGAPIMYHTGIGVSEPVFLNGQLDRGRNYTVELPQLSTDSSGSGPCTPRRQQRRNRVPGKDYSAFGYESDDSSLSSGASGSNKSGESTSRQADYTPSLNLATQHGTYREWRGSRSRRSPHRQRRIAPERYLHATYPFQVKFTPDDLLNGSKWDTLSQEIWDKFVKAQQTEETFRKKMNLWKYLYLTIKSIFPRYGLYVVGSTMSGFGLDLSDMDLCLYLRVPENIEPRHHALLHLNYILNYIRSFDPGAELIQAKVPILKFRDPRSGVQVDLNCNNVVGIKNTNLLYCYSRMDWRVRPLVVLMKLWAQAHDINDARHRTLSSYSLTLMVIQFLQCGSSPGVLPPAPGRPWEARSSCRTPLGELFHNMLAYYANYPYDRLAVSVRAGRPLPVTECRLATAHKNDPHQWKLLCVEEPFDLTNTARSVYDPETFEKIVATFRQSHQRLSSGLRLADAWPAHER